MVIAVGVDIVDVARFEAACERTAGFLDRVLLPAEHEGRSLNSRAVRFAAKEAVAKALGAPGNLAWHDCEIRTTDSGQPYVHVTGSVAARASELGITSWHLSLSHDGGSAIAFVVAS
jgi:holo-[acyl-carrier protein] synthase